MKRCLLFFLFVCAAAAQQTSTEVEEKDLSSALAEAGTSQVDFIRALENHLTKYPMTAKRPEIERALVKASIEAKDNKRIILYGERVLDREAGDPQILDRVTRALLSSDAKDTSERALKYAQRYEAQLNTLRRQPPVGHFSKADWSTEVARGIARAVVLEARATGNLGKYEDALKLAQRSFDEFPTAEGAREIGRCLMKMGRDEEAIPHFADAFTISDARNTEAARAQDRIRMGELYKKLKGSETGLGDLILESYDRTTALVAEAKLRLRESDPNAQVSSVMDFTLPGVKGDKLALASLKGKTIVFDFWATWCGPCRAQHPLYAKVKEHFADDSGVAFISVNTDEDRDLVEPFLEENHWANAVYFEDGLSRMLQITSIPTTIIVDKHGDIASRMNGFNPDRFVDLLTERIRQTLKD
ncbi:MAG TPA: TlpA disulfide reductase family protein [Bryobacteraceae bacterium]|nr:TlpA disulfide reductase family protein [Bryobacteraceae bacterium]